MDATMYDPTVQALECKHCSHTVILHADGSLKCTGQTNWAHDGKGVDKDGTTAWKHVKAVTRHAHHSADETLEKVTEIVAETGLTITGYYMVNSWYPTGKLLRKKPRCFEIAGLAGVRVSYTGRGGKVANFDSENFDVDKFTADCAAVIPTSHPYYEAAQVFRGFLATETGRQIAAYPTTYGVGVWIAYNYRAEETVFLLKKLFDARGVEYKNEFSGARWVFRFKISKAKGNLAQLKTLLAAA